MAWVAVASARSAAAAVVSACTGIVVGSSIAIGAEQTRAPIAERSGKEIVQAHCVKCHQDGIGGAPKIGDNAAWRPRLKHGLDALVRSAIHGHGGMAPRGGVANLTDAELQAAIVYMFNPAGADSKAR